jgi:hypothetical protein
LIRQRRSYFDADVHETVARAHSARPGNLGAEAGAIRECEEHRWMYDRADPHAKDRALTVAREDPPAGVSPHQAVAEIRDFLESIGDTCKSARRSECTRHDPLYKWSPLENL